jgi:hypothetical protein
VTVSVLRRRRQPEESSPLGRWAVVASVDEVTT